MRFVDSRAHQLRVWHIERAAMRLFAARGYAETSLDEVAKACGMRKASLYHYFMSKEVLLHGIIDAMVHKICAQMLKVPGHGGNIEESLYRIGMQVLDNLSAPDHRNFVEIMVRDAGTNPYIRRVFFKVAKRTMEDAQETLFEPSRWKGRRISARQHMMHLHQFVGSIFRYGIETRIWKAGPAMTFGEREYVRSLARVFARGIGA